MSRQKSGCLSGSRHRHKAALGVEWETVAGSEQTLLDVRLRELPPRPVADVEHFNLLLPFQHSVNRPITIHLVTVMQVPVLIVLRSYRTAVRLLFQAKNRFRKSAIPSQGGIGVFGVDLQEEQSEVALGSGGQFNEVGHA